MKLELVGSPHRYALEQLAISMFPSDHNGFDDFLDTESASCTVMYGYNEVYVYAKVHIRGVFAEGTAKHTFTQTDTATDRDIWEKWAIRTAFYIACTNATGEHPDWGSLSGVRPAKLARMKLEQGMTKSQVFDELCVNYYVSKEKARLACDLGELAYNMKSTLKKRDISLYISIPFCPTRCSYCSFVSGAIGSYGKLIEPYLEALLSEIKQTAKALSKSDISVDTVYIGGGTPTTLSALELDTLCSCIKDSFDLSHMREFTVEAGRPDTITYDKLVCLKQHGVTRISVNPQTMNDDVLRLTGRKHTVEDTVNAYMLSRELGFSNINMDLIAGLHGDCLSSFCEGLKRVISLAPTDITVHTLALKKGADYRAHGTVTESELGEMLKFSRKVLTENGYKPYYLYRQKYNRGSFENVGYTSNSGCAYNVLMMEEIQTILSFGAGAVTKLHDIQTGSIKRITNHKYPFEYIRDISHIIDSKKKLVSFFDVCR